ncbi:hypothetical protein DOY81_005019, partial [Sarcophaga bullata]
MNAMRIIPIFLCQLLFGVLG